MQNNNNITDEQMMFILQDKGISFYAYNSWSKFGRSGKAGLLFSLVKDQFDGNFQDTSHQFFFEWFDRITKHTELEFSQFKRLMFKEFEFWVRWHNREKWIRFVDVVPKEQLENIIANEEQTMFTERMDAVLKYCETVATEEEKFIIDYLMMDNKTKNSYWTYSQTGSKSNDRRTIVLPTGKSYSKQTFYNLVNNLKTKLCAFVEKQLEAE
jgi:hypothetical protein